MNFNRAAQRAIIAIFFALLTVVYAIAWLAPAIGFAHDDAVYLVTAKAMAAGLGYRIGNLPNPAPQTLPPLFPGILALFTLVSQQPQWLKVLPLACSAGWLALTWKLLRKMGASGNDALLLVWLTAASPTVIFLSTNLLAESLFALLMTAALLTLLEDRALLAGFFAGLATLTRGTGVALIAACMLTLVIRRRFRSAVIFTALSMAMVAPWFGWSLARAGNRYLSSNILTALPASDKLLVLGQNMRELIASPFALLSGFDNTFAIVLTIVALLWTLFVRRQLLPDLFIVLYCAVLLCWIWPPERVVAAILPLVLWIVWRVIRLMKTREALAAFVVIAAIFPIWADARRIPVTRASGSFPIAATPPDNWMQLQKLFGAIRANTAPDSVLLANLNAMFYLNTGRKTIRGFEPNGFEMFYAPRPSAVKPDRLANAILGAHADYVALTPDLGFAEAASFRKSVEALERGGVLEPTGIPALSRDYQLLRVTR